MLNLFQPLVVVVPLLSSRNLAGCTLLAADTGSRRLHLADFQNGYQ